MQNTKKRFWRDWEPIAKMTFVMALFTVIYSLITAGLYCIANRQLDGMKKDQRPWIRLWSEVSVSGKTMPVKTSPITITLHVLNVGKTPAKSFSADIFVEPVKNGTEPRMNKSPRLVNLATGVVFPNVPTEFPVNYTLLQSEWEDYKEGRAFLIIYSHIVYKDLFQKDHWTDSCEYSGPHPEAFSSAKNCTDYNNTDDN